MYNFGMSFKLGRSKESQAEAEQWEIVDDSLQAKVDRLQIENRQKGSRSTRQQAELKELRADIELLKQLISKG